MFLIFFFKGEMNMNDIGDKKLSWILLIGFVIGLMIGGGVFNI